MIRGKNYDCCSACSDKITGAFKSEGWQFVKKALNEKGFINDLSGLAEVRMSSVLIHYKTDAPQVQRSAEKALAEMEWSEDEGEENEEEGEGEII